MAKSKLPRRHSAVLSTMGRAAKRNIVKKGRPAPTKELGKGAGKQRPASAVSANASGKKETPRASKIAAKGGRKKATKKVKE